MKNLAGHFNKGLFTKVKNSKLFKKQDVGITVPQEVYNFKVFLYATFASFAAVIIGYDAGFIGGTVTLPSFESEFGLDTISASKLTLIKSNVVSVFQAGAFFGAIFAYPIGELLGRKVGLIVSGFFLTFGAGISLAAKSSTGLGPIYAGRVLTGLGVGGCSGLTPIYISEIAPVAIRGQLVGMWEISWQVGGIIGYWINYGVLQNIPDDKNSQWLIPFAIQLIPSGLFWIGSFILPESPRWLLLNNKHEKCLQNLSNLRNLPLDDPYLNFEMSLFEKDFQAKKASLGLDSTSRFAACIAPIRKTFTSKKTIIRLILSTSLFPMQNGSGINAVTYYSPTVFKSFGISGSNSGLLSTGIFGIIKAVASVFWILFIVDNFGRRWALFWGSFPCAICMWYIGAYIKISDPSKRIASGDTKLDDGGKAALGLLYIWTFFYGISWNGTVWVYNSEIFDQHIRTFVQAINACSNWFWAFIMGRFTGNMFDKMGYGVYFLFAGCMTVFPWIVYLFYPETKGVPFEAVDYLFEVQAWKARKYALDKYNIQYDQDERDFNEMVNAQNDLVSEISGKEKDIQIELLPNDSSAAASSPPPPSSPKNNV